MNVIHKDPQQCVSSIIETLGNEIVIASPLGLGKPVQLLNAFYKYAKENPHIQLKILSALSLAKPTITNPLAKRLSDPILERLYNRYTDLDYEVDRRIQKMPDNIQVIEFYFAPGEYIHNSKAQQNYIYSNYTHVVRDIMRYNINVIAQLISNKNDQTEKYSFSCNADLTLDLMDEIEISSEFENSPLLLGEINENLPYMYGDSAEVGESKFSAIVDNQNTAKLFNIPRPSISKEDFMIGLYSSSLIKDDGCLQIGIGSLSDALVACLVLRHNNNDNYNKMIDQIQAKDKFGDVIKQVGETSVFNKGLFSSTEMLVDGFLDLYHNKILIKKVYDDVILQQLLNDNIITEKVSSNTIEQLIAYKRISEKLTFDDFKYLQHFGIFKDKDNIQYHDGYIWYSIKSKVIADLSKKKSKDIILNYCLGDSLKNGRIAHASFFIGSQSLYDSLRDMSISEKKLFEMRSIKRVNQLYHSEEIDIQQRINARFVNSSMKVTLLGSVGSDTLENGSVISGVGGQYNFVAMAHELKGARSIINCRSTYVKKGKVKSNIVWDYSQITIPRHLRDIVVTEYGIADCRSKTDSEVVKALLNIADSRFQEDLLASAKKAGKLPKEYKIPEKYTNNLPKTISHFISSPAFAGSYKHYPFDTELTEEEVEIRVALNHLKSISSRQHIFYILKGIFKSRKPYKNQLTRMELYKSENLKTYIYQRLLISAFNHINFQQ